MLGFDTSAVESMLKGSHVNFKKRLHQPYSEAERELEQENKTILTDGIRILRKLRTLALTETNPVTCQQILREAHQFSTQMAETILAQRLAEKPIQINPEFLTILKTTNQQHRGQDAGSGHGIPPSESIENLFQATDDMLVRIEEKASSPINPDHQLSQEEIKYVIKEFLIGTNDLSINAINKFFALNTKVGGILSGGSVYLELVKKIIEIYGSPELKISSFIIAVDKDKKQTKFETIETDKTVKTVIMTDDVIDRGGTLLTALWATGEHFPEATIYSGLGTDQPGGFQERREQKLQEHLFLLFQDFAELVENKKIQEALQLFEEASKYAQENKIELSRGWYSKKEKIEKGLI